MDDRNNHIEMLNVNYKQLLNTILLNIRSTRISLARRMNDTIIQLYWNIGKELFDRKIEEGYSGNVINRLSIDLKKEFPNFGFSPRNLWDMKRFYERFNLADQKLRQLVAVLPEDLQEQADEILKNRYNLTFLNIAQPLKELELEKKLVEKIKFFILELGQGFSFIGDQYRLTLNDKEYFIDMLFFNRCTRSLVAIELKIGDFKPEYISKMGFYLTLLDNQVKIEGENPSIGIILCADKDNDEVDIALQTAVAPIGVADYQLNFPDKEIKQLIKETLIDNKQK